MEKSSLYNALIEAQEAGAWVTIYGCSPLVFKPESVEASDYQVVIVRGQLSRAAALPVQSIEEVEPVTREEAQSGEAMKERLARLSNHLRKGILTLDPHSVNAVFVHTP